MVTDSLVTLKYLWSISVGCPEASEYTDKIPRERNIRESVNPW